MKERDIEIILQRGREAFPDSISPASVYRVLKEAGLMESWNRKPSKKGTGFHQPASAHEHWHVDVSYINVCGTFYYLCSVLDGYSRYIVHWEVREAMKERDIEIILQRGREAFPDAQPRIISDNGPQFIAKDFKEFIRVSGMTHVRTSPYYPQSNGKIERWHKSLKTECVRPLTLSTRVWPFPSALRNNSRPTLLALRLRVCQNPGHAPTLFSIGRLAWTGMF